VGACSEAVKRPLVEGAASDRPERRSGAVLGGTTAGPTLDASAAS
jgi:hypothetical protein